VFIWGLLEARLQSVDTIVLGGLAETIWPPATDPGPWMSRPMRAAAGLPSPEEAVGQSAHDFVSATCAAPIAVLSCPRRRDGAPAVPARWLARIEACLGTSLPHHPAAAWARLLDQPEGKPRPVSPPAPRPPVAWRPRRLSVTEIGTWLADPYAIYAKHILRLVKLRPLEEATDAADYGSIVHAGFQIFLARHGIGWTAQSGTHLREAMLIALGQANLRRALVEWWTPRLLRIADWATETEIHRRAKHQPMAIGTELSGQWNLSVPNGFRLTGRADRIEKRADGSLAIIDYKTGSPPSKAAVEAGIAPQLPLEAAMAASGAFGHEWQGQAAELAYWQVSGAFVAGREAPLFKSDAAAIAQAAQDARDRLWNRVESFDDRDVPYLAQPHAGLKPRFSDYGQLARVAEWELGDEA
jgi:ATP-dependent helicase/nuclease subunit B